MAEVRLARLEDVPAIVDISNDAAARTVANFAIEPEPIESWQMDYERTHETYPWLVAEADGIRGFAKAAPWKGRCAYAHAAEVTVYVRPDHHRRGLGRALYGVLLPTLREQGYHSVIGGITLPNDASVRLHESFGMRCIGVFHQVGWKFGRWHDVGYWQKTFGDADATPAPAIKPVGDVMP